MDSGAPQEVSSEAMLTSEVGKGDILHWLSEIDMEQKHHEILDSRIAGTAEWVIHSPEYRAWYLEDKLEPKKRTLFCSGLPDVGKTTLTAVMIEHLRCSRLAGTAVAYFYCAVSRTAAGCRSSAYDVLSTLCKQLAAQCEPLPGLLVKLYRKQVLCQAPKQLEVEDLVLILISLCRQLDRLYIFIDAIDELENVGERSLLLPKLTWMRNHGARILVTSTLHGDIVMGCHCHDDILETYDDAVRLSLFATKEDVRHMISLRLRSNVQSQELLKRQGVAVNAIVNQVIEKYGLMIHVAQLGFDQEIRRIQTLNSSSHVVQLDPETESNQQLQDLASPLSNPLSLESVIEDLDGTSNNSALKTLSGEPTTSNRKGKLLNSIKAATSHIRRSSSLQTRKPRGVHHSATPTIPLPVIRSNSASTLERGLHKIMDQEPVTRELASRILCWVSHAREPLHLGDIISVVGMDLGSTPHHFQMDLPNVHISTIKSVSSDGRVVEGFRSIDSLQEACGNLILIDFDGKISLSPLLDTEKDFWGRRYPNAESEIASICLRYLCREEVINSSQRKNFKDFEEFWSAQQGLWLKAYAERHWTFHLLASGDASLDDLVIHYLHKVTQQPASWEQEVRPLFGNSYHVVVEDNETALLKAARLGIERVVERLLADTMSVFDDKKSYRKYVNAVSFDHETAMSVAVDRGFTGVVQLLYRYGASIHHQDKYGKGLLHSAATKDDELMTELLILCGLDPNTTAGRYAETALHIAAQNGSVHAGKVLLENEADSLSRTRGDNVMHIAAARGDLEFAKILVEHGFDVAAPGGANSGSTYLSEAATSDSVELVSYLIDKGVNIFETDNRKSTAIHKAAWKGKLGNVKVLVEHGADPFVEDDGANEVCDGETALGAAIQHKNKEVVEYLLPLLTNLTPKPWLLTMAALAIRRDLSETGLHILSLVPGSLEHDKREFESTVLGSAVVVDNDEITKRLLQRGAQVEAADRSGWRALHVAADRNLCKAARVLLMHGANPVAETAEKVTPLHLAAYHGHIEVLELLLDNTTNLSVVADDDSTPLIAAAYGSKADAVELLLSHGAPVNDFNKDGESTLHHAVLDNDLDLVQRILEYHPDLSILSRKGGGPLHLASFKGHIEVVRSLISAKADVALRHEFREEAYVPPETERHRYNIGLPWNRRGHEDQRRPRTWSQIESGYTALHSAARGGHPDIVEELLHSGADLRLRGPVDETPLHIAASATSLDTMELLLRFGADTVATTHAGDTPLHWAAAASAAVVAQEAEDHFKCNCQMEKEMPQRQTNHRKAHCVKLLLDFGANPAAENHRGDIPLSAALEAGHVDVVNVLLDWTIRTAYAPNTYERLLSNYDADGSFECLKLICQSFTETEPSRSAWDAILVKACKKGSEELVQLALAKGANPNASDVLHETPLTIALKDRRVRIVVMLLSANARLDIIDPAGWNALHVASSRLGDWETVMTYYPGDRNKASIAAFLVEDGIEVNSRTLNGKTPLHLAVVTGDDILVRTLLEKGASVDVRDNDGRTPLHAALCGRVFVNTVQALLDYEACVTAQDHRGSKPAALDQEPTNRRHGSGEYAVSKGRRTLYPSTQR